MKIRSLLLGSVAAAGLSTGAAHAADLGVLTSLDVCDDLGLSGLTISSDTNCLQITGEVKYKFTWGDSRPGTAGYDVEVNGTIFLNLVSLHRRGCCSSRLGQSTTPTINAIAT